MHAFSHVFRLSVYYLGGHLDIVSFEKLIFKPRIVVLFTFPLSRFLLPFWPAEYSTSIMDFTSASVHAIIYITYPILN